MCILVVDNMSEGKNKDVIVEKIMNLYGVDRKKAQEYFEKYNK